MEHRQIVPAEKIIKAALLHLRRLRRVYTVLTLYAPPHRLSVQDVLKRHFVCKLEIAAAQRVVRQPWLAVYIRILRVYPGKQPQQHVPLVGVRPEAFPCYQQYPELTHNPTQSHYRAFYKFLILSCRNVDIIKRADISELPRIPSGYLDQRIDPQRRVAGLYRQVAAFAGDIDLR